jgi:GxxExxY protein
VLVEDAVIVELKTVESLAEIHRAQIISYLKISGRKVGLLINFNAPSLRGNIRRVLNGF